MAVTIGTMQATLALDLATVMDMTMAMAMAIIVVVTMAVMEAGTVGTISILQAV